MSLAPPVDLDLIRRIEDHAVSAWPAAVCERAQDGWVFRATPGLDRGRSNNALAPVRELSPDERLDGVRRVREFAARHGIRPGIQLSPRDLHEPLLSELLADGWRLEWPVSVQAGGRLALAGGPAGGRELELTVSETADPDWLEAWTACEGRADVEAHAETVFRFLGGRARFARSGRRAVGITVESDGLVGLFCLAVAPSLRRQGLGGALVRALLRLASADLAYLQVHQHNEPGLALYARLGFEPAYSYCHCVAPA